MCRHLAWLGVPRSLHDLVMAAPHSLYEQSWAPRLQQHGTVNVDGFGAGWYVPGRAVPVRFRRAQPIWTDASFASLAPTILSDCVLAAVRSATPGTTTGEAGAAPFSHGPWLFSHNGRLQDWPTARKALAGRGADVPDARVDVDSALLFGLAVASWEAGASLTEGLVEAAAAVEPYGGGRVSLLATDGARVAGVLTGGETMHVRVGDHGVLVASEPDDDSGVWRQLPDRAVVEVTADGVEEGTL